MPTLKKFVEDAGLPPTIRRWSQAAAAVRRMEEAGNERRIKQAEAAAAKWHPQVNQELAKRDGLGPDDFRWDQWPVENARIERSRIVYRPFFLACDMPAAPPEANQWIQAHERQEGIDYKSTEFGRETWYAAIINGMALSRVKFQIRDADSYDILCESHSLPLEGVVQSGPRRDSELWRRVTPGLGPVRVRLHVIPLFYFLTPDGAAHTEYANMNNGYFSGVEIQSRVYTLEMTEGVTEEDPTPMLLIDGKVTPESEAMMRR